MNDLEMIAASEKYFSEQKNQNLDRVGGLRMKETIYHVEQWGENR